MNYGELAGELIEEMCSYLNLKDSFALLATCHRLWSYNNIRNILFKNNMVKNIELKWAAERNCALFKWLSKGQQVSPNMISWVAPFGDLQVVKYLFEDWGQIPMPYAINSAAYHGKVEIVKYLLDVGAPYTYEAIYKAKLNDHQEVLKLLYENLNDRKFKFKPMIYNKFKEIINILGNPTAC